MCGIVGIVRRRVGVARDLVKSLKKLEYRGYDSAGIALLSNGKIEVIKGVGTIDKVVGNLEGIGDGYAGIGHTRWATHGGVSPENAHPHLSCHGEVAVVHNGTLDDFEEMRSELMEKGHELKSETDTEVVAHLIEENLKDRDPFNAFVEAIRRLRGSYAIVSMMAGERALFLARNKSPLVIGLGDDGNYCASDVAALLHLTRRFIFLEDGEIAVLTPSKVEIWRFADGRLERVDRKADVIDWSPQLLDRGSFEHFMLKEIYEQPHVLKKIAESVDYYRKFSTKLDRMLEDGSLTIVAAGTSYHAGLIGKFLLSKLAGVRSEVLIASEFPEWSSHIKEGDVILAISQSGETADVLEAVRMARTKGARVISIVNVPGSTLTRMSDESVFIQAGPEVGVAATKTFTAQVAVLYVISSVMSGGNPSRELLKISDMLYGSMETFEHFAREVSDLFKEKEHVFFLGRGINYPTALEGALKLKEISYIHAEGYPAGEYKHGPLALIERGTPTVMLVPIDENLRRKALYNLMEVRSRGALTVTLQPEGADMPGDESLEVACTEELLSPLAYAVPLQLMAYRTAVLLGRNPDKPRNLAKSVTVE